MLNREQWLVELTEKLRPYFKDKKFVIPPVLRISCGWPSSGGTTGKTKNIGECWHADHTKDGIAQLFISPLLDLPGEVAATLVHELLHACLDKDDKHGKNFKAGMKELGLEGKATATKADFALESFLLTLTSDLGDYPNIALDPSLVKKEKKQTVRMHKCTCDQCGYTVRCAKKWLDKSPPYCGYEHALKPMTWEHTEEEKIDNNDNEEKEKDEN